MGEIIAVIDTETNFKDQLISVGVVAVDSDLYEIIDEYYGIFAPEYKSYSMFAHVLKYDGVKIDNVAEKNVIYSDLINFLDTNRIRKIFAYNAKFDYGHLKELQDYKWYDIMRLAAYKQYNNQITDQFECYNTGRLKRHYGVEDIYRLLSGNYRYCEVHNALADARDEMQIMKMMGHGIDVYDIACIN